MRRLVFALALACSGLAAKTSSASFIVQNADVNGLRTFKDNDTGRVWVDLDNFFGLSYNQMKTAVEAAGFTVAVRSEVQGLLDGLPLPDTTTWDTYATIMGRAPNRALIWGAYVPEIPGVVSWAFAFRGDGAWSYATATGFGLNDVPNAGSGLEDMNIWAFQGGGPAPTATPVPMTVLAAGLGGLLLSAGGALRRRGRRA